MLPDEDRDLLMNVAYRLLGSVAEAEDAVQEAYIRWYARPEAERAKIVSVTAWLITTVSRICLDMLGSARARRERYVGEWLPEPVPASARWTSQAPQPESADPADRVTLAESLDMALLVVLESMTPAERVAFVLHDVFRYRYAEIAEIVGRTPAACRQLAASARRRVAAERPSVPAEEHARTLRALKSAWESGDIEAMVALLDPRVVAVADGGGRVPAAVHPVRGPEAVARFAVGVLARQPGLRVEIGLVNGEEGLVARDGAGTVLSVVTIVVARGRVERIWAVRNPEKIARWAGRSDS